jgi:endonuclease YncB( thermonuclease family)
MFFVRVAFLHLLFTNPVLAADFTGLVISVLDGDTIEVLHNNRPERIRLSGIDCPEKGQAYGQRAKRMSHSRLTASTSTVAPLPM